MRRLNTAEFKREYRSLTEPVLVTSGGKSIGVWTPTISRLPDYEGRLGRPSKHQVPARTWRAVAVPSGLHPSLRWRRVFPYPEDRNAR